MAVYTIGKLIKETRERLHISQEELCGVVIAVSTLSKIENGKAAPSKKVREYLNLTLPSFSTGMSLCNHYFSTLELLLINNIAICHYSSNKEEAMHMMRELFVYNLRGEKYEKKKLGIIGSICNCCYFVCVMQNSY
jgi:transcriptional regulator with XRE-family HTH domain